MIIGTIGFLNKPYTFEMIKTQLKYKFKYEIASNIMVLLHYYVFCWFMWFNLLIDLFLNKNDE